jgi:hypothetical protein
MVGRKEPCESYVLRLVAAIIISIGITPPILALKPRDARKKCTPQSCFIEADRVDKKHFLQKNFYSATWGKREMMSRSDG